MKNRVMMIKRQEKKCKKKIVDDEVINNDLEDKKNDTNYKDNDFDLLNLLIRSSGKNV